MLAVDPGKSACLGCLVKEPPAYWKRRFPVIGAVSAMVAQIAALEGIKLLTRFAEPAVDRMIHVDARWMRMKKVRLVRDADCYHCSGIKP